MANENGVWIMRGLDWDNPYRIRTWRELINWINEVGFLPLFANEVRGFSAEEHVSPNFWWTDNPEQDPWLWREYIARSHEVAYGKFFGKKAGFISKEWLPYFANYRRNGYDFDARVDDGLAPFQDRHLYGELEKSLSAFGSITSKGLKHTAGFDSTGGRKGFETIITRLQMQCYVCVSDFPYLTDKNGNSYGWGITEYSTPEMLYGDSFTKGLYGIEPEESKEIIKAHLLRIAPDASEKQIEKFIG